MAFIIVWLGIGVLCAHGANRFLESFGIAFDLGDAAALLATILLGPGALVFASDIIYAGWSDDPKKAYWGF